MSKTHSNKFGLENFDPIYRLNTDF